MTLKKCRLLALLALAFRSHQFYFSHAHDVTRTLQSLRVSASRAAAATASASDVTAKRRGKKTPSRSKNTRADTTGNSGKKGKKDRKGRRRGGRWGQGQASPHDTKASSLGARRNNPPPDPRFFWNLGVLGALVELRDRLDEDRDRREGDGSGGEDGGGGGDTAPRVESATGRRRVEAVDRWLTPVMSGFLQVERGCRVGERGFDVLFVSRRSRLRQGTRFTRRGIDDGGNVANFVETEQARAGVEG